MKLYIIRHAHAEERHTFALTGKPDSKRPLTDRGRDRMKKVITYFKKQEPDIDLFLQSELTRSQQTVDLFKDFYKTAKVETSDFLNPGHSARALFDKIQSYDLDSLAIVGHEPDLGHFLSWVLFRQATDHFPLKKGGIAKVDLYKDGRAYLKWLLRPKLIC
ncbi:MAG: phosphohistidine phosphatase SixA [Bdellovibrionales bacterium]|nr:phosphohistidine phosphatase SixA [Bdellovibrionales bacterium]